MSEIDKPHRFRIELTTSCRDCNLVPKVANAGQVVGSIQIMHNGLRVVHGGYHGAWMAEIIQRLRGHHEPQEELIFHELMKHVRPAATMLELGGFWSYYSLWFLKDSPARMAIVLEPDPAHIEIGRRNAELNNSTIEFVQASVGGENIQARDFRTETSGIVNIPELTVESLMDRFRVEHLDILHCDTQGAESSVIASCERLIKDGRITFGVFSTHAFQISGDPLTHQKCLQMLKDYGARILAEHDVHESYSGDGLIAACFGKEPLGWVTPQLSYNRYSNGIFRNPIYDLAEALQKSVPVPQLAMETTPAAEPTKNRPVGWFSKLAKR